MMIVIRNQATAAQRAQVMEWLCQIPGTRTSHLVSMENCEVVVTDTSGLDSQAQQIIAHFPAVERICVPKTTYQLVSKAFKPTRSQIVVGRDGHGEPLVIGGDATTERGPLLIAGPCSVEGRPQILAAAQAVKEAGAHLLRAG